MSYCVKCGVELDPSLEKCPLCGTPVWHPPTGEEEKPYPEHREDAGKTRNNGLVILITVFVCSTAAGCILLNLLLFTGSLWSLNIIGACIFIWLFFIPAMISRKLHTPAVLALDGCGVGIYCWIIALQFHGQRWYPEIALPLIAIGTVFIVVLNLLYRHVSSSILCTAINTVLASGAYTVIVDLLIGHFKTGQWHISWSAIVITCCLIMAVSLFTIMRVTRLREEVRRRMHI